MVTSKRPLTQRGMGTLEQLPRCRYVSCISIDCEDVVEIAVMKKNPFSLVRDM